VTSTEHVMRNWAYRLKRYEQAVRTHHIPSSPVHYRRCQVTIRHNHVVRVLHKWPHLTR
jgi:hypothetical protein